LLPLGWVTKLTGLMLTVYVHADNSMPKGYKMIDSGKISISKQMMAKQLWNFITKIMTAAVFNG